MEKMWETLKAMNLGYLVRIAVCVTSPQPMNQRSEPLLPGSGASIHSLQCNLGVSGASMYAEQP